MSHHSVSLRPIRRDRFSLLDTINAFMLALANRPKRRSRSDLHSRACNSPMSSTLPQDHIQQSGLLLLMPFNHGRCGRSFSALIVPSDPATMQHYLTRIVSSALKPSPHLCQRPTMRGIRFNSSSKLVRCHDALDTWPGSFLWRCTLCSPFRWGTRTGDPRLPLSSSKPQACGIKALMDSWADIHNWSTRFRDHPVSQDPQQ